MTSIASIIPDTKMPVAADLMQPSGAQQVTPVDDSVSSRHTLNGAEAKPMESPTKLSDSTANNATDTQAGQAAAAEVKPGGIMPMLKAPLKGPRGGIHWGAGLLNFISDIHNRSEAKGQLFQHSSVTYPGL